MSTREKAGTITHGGSLDHARGRFPDAPAPFIDLSTGINPVPYPFSPIAPEAFTRLPEPGALWALQEVAARAYGVTDPAMVVAAPGTQILINLLPRLWPQTAVSVLGPTYAEHTASWAASGAAVHETTAFRQMGAHPAAVLCNPNNPDGRRTPPADLLALAAQLRLLIIDEAFADFEGPGLSLAPHLPRGGSPGVIVLRSFGKAFGLAGVRLGFAIAQPAAAAVIREALGPWAVSGPALQVASQALGDMAWVACSTRRLDGDAARLDGLLAAAGCKPAGGTRLFRLVEALHAKVLHDRLGRAGIFVRTFESRSHHLRFGIPGPECWGRVQDALAVVA